MLLHLCLLVVVLCIHQLTCENENSSHRLCSCSTQPHEKEWICNMKMLTNYSPECSLLVNKSVSVTTCASGENLFLIDSAFTQNGEHALKLTCTAHYAIDINYTGIMPQTALAIDYGRLPNRGHRYSLTVDFLDTGKSIKGSYTVYSLTNSSLTTSFQLLLTEDTENETLSEVSTELNLRAANDSTSGPFIVCTSKLENHVQRLTSIFASNPTEARLQEDCLYGNHRCLHKREGSLGECSRFIERPGVRFSSHTCVYEWAGAPGGLAACFLEGNASSIIKKEYFMGLDHVLYFKEDYPNGFLSINQSAVIQIDRYTDNVIAGMPYNFSCVASKYFLSNTLSWYFKTTSGDYILIAHVTKKQELISHDERERTKDLKIRNTTVLHFTTDITEVVCLAYLWNTTRIKFKSSIPVNVVENIKPYFNTTTEYPELNLSVDDNKLTCLAYGTPAPTIEWLPIKNGVANWTQDFETGQAHSKSFLWFPQGSAISKLAGREIQCRATNSFGNATKTFFVKIKAPGNGYGLTIGIPVAICISTLIVAIIMFIYYRTKPVGLTKYEIEQFRKGNPNPTNLDYANVIPENIPYKQEYEIDEDELSVDEKNVLGEGAFGLVYLGKYRNRSVAVKTVKDSASKMELKSLLSELKLMMFIGEHEHISKLIGAVTRRLEYGKVHVLIEFYSLGSLENYLRKHRGNFVDSSKYKLNVENKMYMNLSTNPSGYQNLDIFGGPKIRMEDLITWSYQIAVGMEYLSSINVIHGDLAARNVLLDENRQAKIADFGLSRKLMQYTNYVKTSQEPLPWKWLSVESLRDLNFSSASDVWSYGVTLWEIFSLGQIPFGGLNWSVDFVEKLYNGLRMDKPHLCPDEIYFLMMQCWKIEPRERPQFTALKNKFLSFLDELNTPTKIEIDLNSVDI